jgi:hypothetical protein
MTMQGLILLMLTRTSFAAGNGRYWNIHHTNQIWKHHCQGHITTQGRTLFMLYDDHCWISTEMDALIVYDAVHKFGKRWYKWHYFLSNHCAYNYSSATWCTYLYNGFLQFVSILNVLKHRQWQTAAPN